VKRLIELAGDDLPAIIVVASRELNAALILWMHVASVAIQETLPGEPSGTRQ
jgi:hypothetical protein